MLPHERAESLRERPSKEGGASLPGTSPVGAARAVLLALLLSAPVWFGIGVGIWALTRP